MENRSVKQVTIIECSSCSICELSFFMACRECDGSFCQSHYLAHMQDAHGHKMSVTLDPSPLKQVEEPQKFQFILDTVPQWWKDLPGVQIDIGGTIAIIPGSEAALPGDWIIRNPDGSIRTESCDEGRVRARAFLKQLRIETETL